MNPLKESFLGLREKCLSCRECPLGGKLVDGLDPHVFASGRITSPFMFIAECPGAEEVKQKKPLIPPGRSGVFYNEHILAPLGLARDEVYTTNTVLCRTNEKNRTPLEAEILLCRSHLDAQMCLLDPKLIVMMGNVPLYGVCEINGGITRLHGQLRRSRVWSNGKAYPVFPLYHPAYVLRGSGRRELEADIVNLKTLVEKVKNGEDI
jgi:DNA polymerase